MKVDNTFIKKVKKVCMPMAREIRLTFRKHEDEYKFDGLWGIDIKKDILKEIDENISEGIVISTFGVIHHTDSTLSKKDVLIPLCRNADKYNIRYVGHKKEDGQEKLKYLQPILFNPREFHSVAPNGFPTKLPLIVATLTFPDNMKIET
jgi:hypothetical protein